MLRHLNVRVVAFVGSVPFDGDHGLVLCIVKITRAARPVRIVVIVLVSVTAVAISDPERRRHLDAFLGRHEDATLFTAAGLVTHRAGEARLSGLSSYRPFAPANSVVTEVDAAEAMDRIASKLEEQAKKSPTAANFHAFGVTCAAGGRWEDAVRALEQALRLNARDEDVLRAMHVSRDARLLSDASAAYSGRYRALRRPQDALLAAEAAELAWKRGRRNEAAWNRAVAWTGLHLRAEARRAWRDSIVSDPDSPWADEARERLRERTRRTSDHEPLTLRDPQRLREYLEEELLEQWGRSVESQDDPAAAALLASARLQSAALRRTTGESLPADAVDTIDGVSSPSDRARLAEAHVLYSEGRRLYRLQRVSEARDRFRRAEEMFRRTRSPFAFLADLEGIACAQLANDLKAARASAAALRHETERHAAYLNLRGRVFWIQGLIEAQLGHPDDAIINYNKALQNFERGGERENVATIESRLADAFERVGETEQAAVHRDLAFTMIEAAGYVHHEISILFEAADARMSYGYLSVAEVLLGRLTRLAAEAKSAMWQCTALTWRSALAAQEEAPDAARATLHDAEGLCNAVDERAVRDRVVANLGFVDRDMGGQAAATTLEAAIGFFRRTGGYVWLPDLYRRLGETYAAEGRRVEADRAFRSGITEVESLRAQIDDSLQREAFLRGADRLFGATVDLLLDEGRDEEALAILDRGRARDLVDVHAGLHTGQLFDHLERTICRRLPADVVLLEQHLRRRELVTWAISADGIRVYRSSVSPTTFAEHVRTCSSVRTLPIASASLSILYDVLFRDALEAIAPEAAIVIVPDPRLERIPFAALVDRRTGRHLVEDHATVVAPGAAFFIASADTFSRRSGRPDRILVVGEPAVDAARFPSLPPLPGARRDAKTVSRFYANADVLVGPEATRDAFLALARSATIIQFSGHALSNETTPRFSALVFARHEGIEGSDLLYVEDLTRTRLDGARLAVLSACSTAGRGDGVRIGSATVARAFLAGGVPAVVGTLWPVDDEAAEAFSRSFHAAVQRGEQRPASALRFAQLSMLHSRRPALRSPAAWAGFQVVGAGVELK
jgi:CHAT domain-containing protein/tetratricopeptide (TPR) repeat protein